jgi:hypothetical protein
MSISRWVVLALILLGCCGLAWAFVRQGVRIKPDRDRKPPYDLGDPPTI